MRLSETNYYQSPNWILQLAGHRSHRQIQLNHDIEQSFLLSQLTGIDEEILKSIAFGVTNKGNMMLYNIYKKATQFCPDCLKQSLYFRFLWDTKISRTCPIHRCNLIHKCPQCQQLIKWSRPGIAQCQCGFDLRNSVATVAQDAQVNFSLYLYGNFGQVECLNAIHKIYQADNPVFHLTFNQFSKLSRFLESYIRAYWRHQRGIASSKIVFTEFDSESEILSSEELVFDFFQKWKNNFQQLLIWYESNLEQRNSPSTTVSSMVDFLVNLSIYFPVHCSISILLENYLIKFLSRYLIDQMEIIWTNSAPIRTRSFELKEVEYCLPEIAQTWKGLELSIARLIIASQEVRYFLPSKFWPTGIMTLRNPEAETLRMKLNLCFR